MSRRRRSSTSPPSREVFTITGLSGRARQSRYAHDRLALLEAQDEALTADAPATILVHRRPLVGPDGTSLIYRVERDADGIVFTHPQ